MEENLTSKILDYIQGRGAEKLEKLDKEITKLAATGSINEQDKLEKKQQEMLDTKAKYEPRHWLTDAAKRAKQIQFVTHAIKFIHSGAKASNIYAEHQGENKEGVISTASINLPQVDVCGNAAVLDVAGLLSKVEHEGEKLADAILAEDISPFLPMAENEQQAQAWLAGFKQVFQSKELASHKLAKQVYWPVTDQTLDEYHLLSPLFATSLAQELYNTRKEQRDIQFSKDEAIKAQGFSVLPELAVQTYGGTKALNVSQLNAERDGKNYLLDNRPPSKWEKPFAPPLNIKSVFHKEFQSKVYKDIRQLKVFLEKAFEKNSTITIRDYRAAKVEKIVDALLQFAASHYQLEAGWSKSSECLLPLEEQLWLDPKRVQLDTDFSDAKDQKDWPQQVATRFANWLNAALESKKLALGQVEFAQWKVYVAQELRLTERARKEYY